MFSFPAEIVITVGYEKSVCCLQQQTDTKKHRHFAVLIIIFRLTAAYARGEKVPLRHKKKAGIAAFVINTDKIPYYGNNIYHKQTKKSTESRKGCG